MKRVISIFCFVLLLSACSKLPHIKDTDISFPTKPSIDVNKEFVWQEIDNAKEILNASEKVVYFDGGNQPISSNEWTGFSVSFPWVKNLNRNLLFQKTAFIRSPSAAEDCQSEECFNQIEHKGYTWVELAQPVAVNYIPDQTDIRKPEAGHLVIKTIKKCQVVYFEGTIYQLTDGKGNYYAMHATETGTPDLDASLPTGWSIKKVTLEKPLLIAPFGSKGDCYFNILGDHLGQGYHQYLFAKEVYP